MYIISSLEVIVLDKYKRLPLRIESGRRLFYNQISVIEKVKEIEDLLEEYPYIKDISKEILLKKDINELDKQDIINRHKAYEYILSGKMINEENLKMLYDIRSKDLLDDYSKENMGKFYRQDAVLIIRDGNYLNHIEGMDYKKIDRYVNHLLDFIGGYDLDELIKSQVIHFYLYYIHPYFDINKRTSRALSMWYLVNKDKYQYTLFERGISLNRGRYKKLLFDSRNGNLTKFLNLIILEVQREMERQIVINSIEKYAELNSEEEKIIGYLLTLSNITIKDLANKYNLYNQRMTTDDFAYEYVFPLMGKNVLLNLGLTTHKISKNMPNIVLALNRQMIDVNKLKTVDIKKYSK